MRRGPLPWLAAALLCAVPLCSIASGAVEALLRSADAVRSSEPAKFQAYLRDLNAQAASATPAQQERIAYLNSYALSYAGNYESALRSLRVLFETARDDDVRFRAGALMVNIHAVTKQFTEGLRQLERTLPLIDKVKDPEVRDHGLGVASLIYGKMGQHTPALEHADRLLAATASPRSRCFASQYRIEALQNLGQLPSDDEPLLAAIEHCRSLGEATVTGLLLSALARKWAAQGQADKAIGLLQANMAATDATGYPPVIGEMRSVLAELLLLAGRLSESEENAQLSVAQRAESGYAWYLVSAYKTLYEVAMRRGDTPLALQHYRRYAEADKAYLTEVRTRELAYQVVRQETSQKTQQIELLNRRNEVLNLQQRVDRQSAQTSRLLVLLLALLAGTIGYWAYKIKRVQLSLRRMAETDALTGISNRHHFSQESELTLASCAQSGEDVALIMFDLDHFKSINDRFGHDTGDWALRLVADTCRKFCRRIDHLGRLGGEEFAILLSGCDLRGAKRVADDCRVRIATLDTLPSGHKFVVTASFGVTASSLSGYDLAKLLSNADMMLYRAKREGRNRVCVYDGGVTIAARDLAPLRGDDIAMPSPLRLRSDLSGEG